MTKEKVYSGKHHFAVASAFLMAVLAILGSLFACTRSDHKSAVPTEKITIAYSTPPYTVLIDIAQNRGYFLQEGLEVTLRTYSYGKAAFDALRKGEADVATVGETPFMLAVMKGEKLFIIATIQTSNKNNAVVARKDKGILAPEDLKGRKIGTTFGTTGEFFMDSYLVSRSISRKQMKVVNLAPEEMQTALESGAVDAVSTWSPVLGQLQKQLGGRGTIFYDADIYTQTFSVAAGQEYVRGHPGRIRKLLHALVKAEEFIEQNPVEAQKIIAARSGMDRASVSDMWNDNAFNVTLDQSLILALEDESRWAIKSGLVNRTMVPNYLDYIYLDGLESVKSKAVRILR